MTTIIRRALFAALGGFAAAAVLGAENGPSPGAGQGAQSGYRVTMTWVSGSNRYAAIDGELYGVGDTLPDGGKVLAVESGTVRISKDGVPRLFNMVDKPPPRETSFVGDGGRATLSYLDDAIAELERAARKSSAQPRLDELNALRDRLVDARDRLAGGELSDAERARIETELNSDWLRAQQKLDALRGRIADSDSGTGLSVEQLRSTQKTLEDATLAGLRPSPAQLQQHDLESLLAELLGDYPDYRALVERLEQFQADPTQ